MKLEHDFTVPAPVDEAWKVLLDVERVAPCMPGASLQSVDGDSFTGTVKVKVGPIQVTYKGEARFASRDDEAHRVVIAASGKESRGTGTAAATVTAVLTAAGDSTRVQVETDLDITGRPAQFGRGVMADVGAKLIGQFADCLAQELATPTPDTAGEATAELAVEAEALVGRAEAPQPEPPRPPRPAAEPIDLLEVAGGSVAKRLAPVVGVLLLLVLVVRRRRRRR